jgi:hypothetical protein
VHLLEQRLKRLHTSAYVSIRQRTEEEVHLLEQRLKRLHTSAYVSIRQRTEEEVHLLEQRLKRLQRLLRQYLYFCTSKASTLSTAARPTSIYIYIYAYISGRRA